MAKLAETAISQSTLPAFEGKAYSDTSKLTQYLNDAVKEKMPPEAIFWTPVELVWRTLLHIVANNPDRLAGGYSIPKIAKEVHEKLAWPAGFPNPWCQGQINAELKRILDPKLLA